MACGKKTEVYSRIVGYYRPVQQWNLGKRAEFAARRLFQQAGAKPWAPKTAAPRAVNPNVQTDDSQPHGLQSRVHAGDHATQKGERQ